MFCGNLYLLFQVRGCKRPHVLFLHVFQTDPNDWLGSYHRTFSNDELTDPIECCQLPMLFIYGLGFGSESFIIRCTLAVRNALGNAKILGSAPTYRSASLSASVKVARVFIPIERA